MARARVGRRSRAVAVALVAVAAGMMSLHSAASSWLLPRGVATEADAGRRHLLGAAVAALGGAAPWALPARAEETGDVIATFTVALNGDNGGTEKVKVRLHPEWAPRGVRRFKELVKIGEMKDSAVFHVDDDTAHFGLPAEPILRPDAIKDDIVRVSNRRGTLTFAQSGYNSRVNQLFFNVDDNSHLDSVGYAPIGEVIEGMDVVDKFYDGYGKKPHQDVILVEGNTYLDKRFPKLSKIQDVEVSA